MSIYGSSIVKESSEFSPGLKAIQEAKKNPNSVNMYTSENGYYITTSDIEHFMENANIIDVVEAVKKIAESNNLNTSQITIVCNECCEFVLSSLEESNLVLEKAVEADAMNLNKVSKWYSKVVSASMGKAETKKEIQDRIKVLKKCVEDMEKAKYNDNSKAKYMLKSLIPFNSLYRLIKSQDVYAGIGILSDSILAGSSLVIRYVTYKNMLDSNIKKTNEAIKYLENKLKEM